MRGRSSAPKGRNSHSPGQRPGDRATRTGRSSALKGRNNAAGGDALPYCAPSGLKPFLSDDVPPGATRGCGYCAPSGLKTPGRRQRGLQGRTPALPHSQSQTTSIGNGPRRSLTVAALTVVACLATGLSPFVSAREADENLKQDS